MAAMDDDNPGTTVVTAIERVLDLARTWIAWDGRPRLAEDGERVYTPNKVIRRTADHIVDHLAEIEALLAGVPTQPDEWHASAVTTATDLAPFSEIELREAHQRLRRLARTFELRMAAAGPDEWDVLRTPNWTLREIAVHLGDPWYAEQLGDLSGSLGGPLAG